MSSVELFAIVYWHRQRRPTPELNPSELPAADRRQWNIQGRGQDSRICLSSLALAETSLCMVYIWHGRTAASVVTYPQGFTFVGKLNLETPSFVGERASASHQLSFCCRRRRGLPERCIVVGGYIPLMATCDELWNNIVYDRLSSMWQAQRAVVPITVHAGKHMFEEVSAQLQEPEALFIRKPDHNQMFQPLTWGVKP